MCVICQVHLGLPQTKGLEQQKCVQSQSWWLEVQDQGVGSVAFFWGLSPWLTDSCLLHVSFKKTLFIYLFIRPGYAGSSLRQRDSFSRVHRTLSCSMQTLSCSVWDLVP